MAFNWDAVGAKVAVLPLDTKGRQNKDAVPQIFAHTDFVTDIQFSPFDDGLLATGSQDLTVSFPYMYTFSSRIRLALLFYQIEP